ncbi:hypothetical protein H920_12607 [Fukomys damarensis]|uniref:Uncharacterized protein n=1 Tax=Fukomys damarensis TaxID=885580 RepID=A0A091DTC4_FUKDA|nr:hypothetical protein H920_12607 [Fukomys damarensis]
MKDLCRQAEGTTLEPGNDAHGEDRSSPDKTAFVPSDSEALRSFSNENSLVHIRKSIHSRLLLENQQAKIFPSSSPFMAIGSNLQVDPPRPDHADSVQLGVTS